MKKQVSSKKALLASIMSLVLCCAMLMGTTFAWFTDSVTSGVNHIQAGNLDVEFEYSTDMATWTDVKESESIFNPTALWEPGHTEVVYLKITNAGSLALKYQMAVSVKRESEAVNVANETFKLSDYIKFGQVEDVTTAYANRDAAVAAVDGQTTLISAGYTVSGAMEHDAEKIIALVAYMPEDVDNVANTMPETDMPSIDLGLQIVATQMTSESDSFGITYDENANGVTLTRVNTTVVAAQPVVFQVPGNTPANTGSTVVQFPADAIAGTEAELKVETENIVAANPTFNIDSDGLATVGTIELNLTVDGTSVTTFNGQSATITTTIAKNLQNVSVAYNGEGDQPTNVSYNSATGELTFTTTHFSTYEVKAIAQTVSKDEKTITLNNETALRAFAAKVNDGDTYVGKTVMLGADIDLGNREWTPIGYSTYKHVADRPFQGTFDGQDHTISNLYVAGTQDNEQENNYHGLFGYLTGTAVIKNFTLHNANVNGSLYVGAVAGMAYTGNEISNITLTGNVRITGWWYVGGIVGNGYINTVKDCTVNANEGSLVQCIDGSYCGGIFGFRGENGHTIVNCSSNIDVTAFGYVGGISGILHYGNTIENCTLNDVTVTQTAPVGQTDNSVKNGIGAVAGIYVNGATATIKGCTGTATLVTNYNVNNYGIIGNNRDGVASANLVLENNNVTVTH